MSNITVRIRIDYEKCIRCKECVKACSYGVLEWFDDKPFVAHPYDCKACSECVKTCSVKAINVYEL